MGKIGVIGAGAWGTALAVAMDQAGHEVWLQAHEAEVTDQINRAHMNKTYLQGIDLPPALRAVSQITDLADSDVILLVTPAQFVRPSCAFIKEIMTPDVPILICAKGIERDSGFLLSEVISQELAGATLGILSGPTFARELAQHQPTACTLAMENMEQALEVAEKIGSSRFRIYASDDIIGAQIGGAVKNVLAIASGIASGKGYGDNARAALITRGISELTRLGVAKGAKAETLMGLSGMGDLILTCNSMQSRNFSLGFALGEGQTLTDILAKRTAVTEGVYSARSACDLAQKLQVEMPICQAVMDVLEDKMSVDQVVETLLARPFREENQ